MKKTRFIKSLGVVSALTMPMATVLMTTTSCNRTNYFQLAKKFKTTTLNEFMALSKCKRQTWQEKEAFDYIIARMQELGYEPVWSDDYGYRPECVIAAKKDLPEGKYDENLNKYGNIWFDIPASEGCEKYPKVIVHAHQDAQMAFKDDAAEAEWRQNAVDLYYDQDQQIMYSKDYKTSIGADDGVGCAELLAIATHAKDSDFKHGPIRLLFSCDESGACNEKVGEVAYDWQSGAGLLAWDQKNLPKEKRPFDTNLVINLDGYEQNNIVRSCAGIHECIYDNMTLSETGGKIKAINWGSSESEARHEYELTVSIARTTGASSGVDANKGYANALKILAQTIVEWDASKKKSDQVFQLIDATTDTSAYAIPSKATAKFVSYLSPEWLRNKCAEFTEMFESNFPAELGRIKITASEITGADRAQYGFEQEYSRNIFYLINILEFGPVTWLDPQKTKIKTSYNVGPLTASINQEQKTGSVNFHTVSRSSDDEQQAIFTKRVHAYFSYFFELEDLSEELSDVENTVWEIDEENKMANFLYGIEKSFKYNPVYTDIHSWAEISQFPPIISEAGLGQAEMAAIGPTITGTHTRQETFYVTTLDSTLKTLIYGLMNINRIA